MGFCTIKNKKSFFLLDIKRGHRFVMIYFYISGVSELAGPPVPLSVALKWIAPPQPLFQQVNKMSRGIYCVIQSFSPDEIIFFPEIKKDRDRGEVIT